MLDPCIDHKHDPNRKIETWALGFVFKTVHQGANKCLSNAAVIENCQVGHGIANYYYDVIKTSNVKQWSNIPPPPRVRLNNHNINDVHKALFEVHIISDLLFYIINMHFCQTTLNTVVTFA